MTHSKEQSAKRPQKKICRVVSCSNPAGSTKYKGLCFHHRGILQKTPSSKVVPSGPRKPKKKTQKSDRSKWIDKLDSVFSVFVRLRDTDQDGFGRCISSDKMIYYFVEPDGTIKTNCDNGHFENRSKKSLRYSETNCNAQDRHENQRNEGDKTGYRKGLIKKYGIKEVENIEVLVHTRKSYSIFELKELYKHYEEEVKFLLTTKHFWYNQRTQKSLYR